MLTNNEKIQLPPRAYYPIKKAANLLEVGVDDLLFLAESGYIETLRHFSGMWIYEHEADFSFSYYAPDEYSYDKYKCLAFIQQKGVYRSPLTDFTSAYKHETDAFSLSGFLALAPLSATAFYQKMTNNSRADIAELTFVLPNNVTPLENSFEDNAFFAIDMRIPEGDIFLTDLFISYKDMEKINSINQCTVVTSTAKRPVAPSTKTTNSHLELIHSLLEVYCPEAIKQPMGKALPTAYARKGKEIPVSQKTIANWLKQLDEK